MTHLCSLIWNLYCLEFFQCWSFHFFVLFFSIFRQLLKKMQHGVRSNMVRLLFIIWFFLVINFLSFSLLGLLSFCSWFLLGFLQWHVIWLLRVGKQQNSGFWQKLRGHSFPGWHQQGKRNANHWQGLKWMKGWANCKTVFWGNFPSSPQMILRH